MHTGFKSMTACRFLLVYSCHLGLWRGKWFLISRAMPAELMVQFQLVSTSELSLPLHVQPVDTGGGRLWRW